MSTSGRRVFAVARWAAAGGVLGFVCAVAVGTALQPDSYHSSRDFISGLAALDAAHPEVMVAGFQLGAVGLLGAAVAVAYLLPRFSGRLAAALLSVAGVALSVAGFARFDCSRNDAACRAQVEAGMSVHSQVHGRAAIFVFLPLILASFCLAAAIWRGGSPSRRWLGPLALAVGVAELVLTVGVEEQLADMTGLVQRANMVLMLGLPVLVAAGGWRRPAVEPGAAASATPTLAVAASRT